MEGDGPNLRRSVGTSETCSLEGGVKGHEKHLWRWRREVEGLWRVNDVLHVLG